MAGAVANSPGVFSLDLMNEPTVPGGSRLDSGWARYTGAQSDGYCSYGSNPETGRHGTCYVQFITAEPGTRPLPDIARDWTQKMKHAIRFTSFFPNNTRHLITVGVSPPSRVQHASVMRSSTSSARTCTRRDGQEMIDLARTLSQTSQKPVIVGETFPFGDVRRLISNVCNDGTAQGWIGQFDGRVLGETCASCILYEAWYKVQRDYGPAIRSGSCPPRLP